MDTKNMSENNVKYVCSIYENRPKSCIEYPWNHANSHFEHCIFVDVENKKLRTKKEQLEILSLPTEAHVKKSMRPNKGLQETKL